MNRSAKKLLILIAIATFAALCWRFMPTSKGGLPEATPASATAQPDPAEPAATQAVPGMTPRARLIAVETQVNARPDSACAMPAPMVASGADPDDPAVHA